ncbi:adaptor protein MecA [Xylocopilactobacillus apicola]|uniref:Adapter protein MecA n=1 Tax=Xylocopilactobacillus apicola TaxID=2932184 RepID=A0AAU9DU72_9LACO|nr:adaptor protein MecA [Xylocopilactobacillus apicola]BDR59018.1 adapter protein MecA [Xylocopilactobacillus apicola]
MEIDHIDKDNIRVFLVHKDLEERGVTILDLLGNQMQVEKFFYSILEEVDTDHTFSGTQTITFQVMPNEEGLELLISKKPQNFGQKVKRNGNNGSNIDDLFDFDSKLLEDDFDQSGMNTDNDRHFMLDNNGYREDRYVKALSSQSLTYIAKFNSIDDLINLGHFLKFKVKTKLYVYDDQYYVIFTLYKKDSNRDNFTRLITNVNEYGNYTKISAEVLAEHGKVLIKSNIFRTLEKYF